MLTIDGGESGGQVLRTALALSSVTGIPFRMTNIRGSREDPGLKPQHLAAIKTVQKLCNAVIDGDVPGSTILTFYPKQLNGGAFEIDVGTAGSVTLVATAALLPMLFCQKPVRLTITGGTDVTHSPSYDYFAEVLVPQFRQWCEKIDVRLLKRGYYPTGQGKIEISVIPRLHRLEHKELPEFLEAVQMAMVPIALREKGTLMLIKGISHASDDLSSNKVAERQAHAAQLRLSKVGDVKITSSYVKTSSSGSGLTLWAISSLLPDDMDAARPMRLGVDVLGSKELQAEEFGKIAAEQMIELLEAGAPVDPHLADMLVPMLALVGGSYRTSKITEHTKHNVAVVNQFLDCIVIDGLTIKKSSQA